MAGHGIKKLFNKNYSHVLLIVNNSPARLYESALVVGCLDLLYIYHNYCIYHKLLPLIFDRHQIDVSRIAQAILPGMKLYS